MRDKLIVTILLVSGLAAEMANGGSFAAKNIFASITTAITSPLTSSISTPITDPVTLAVTNMVSNPVTLSITNPITQAVTEPATKAISEPISVPITTPVPIIEPKPVARKHNISGRATYYNKRGVRLAQVKLVNASTNKVVKTAYTNFRGHYTFRKVKAGAYKIVPQARRNMRFSPRYRKVVVSSNNITNQNFKAYFYRNYHPICRYGFVCRYKKYRKPFLNYFHTYINRRYRFR